MYIYAREAIMVQISKRLVVKKEIPMDNSKDLVNSLDVALAEYHCNQKNYEKGLQLYREIIPQLSESERNVVINKYISFSLQYAQSMAKDKKCPKCSDMLLMKKTRNMLVCRNIKCTYKEKADK